MLALPIALPATLVAQINYETAKIKCEFDNALPERFRSSMKCATLNLWGTFHFDSSDRFETFMLSTSAKTKFSFPIKFENETFSRARYTAENQVIAAWLDKAVEKRMKAGRELAHLSDEELNNRKFSNLLIDHVSAHEHIDLQEAFLLRLRNAERSLRCASTSNHEKLSAIKRAESMFRLLKVERLEAEIWARDADSDELKIDHWGAENIPDDVQLIYAYRRYHMNRKEAFPLFNYWGEPLVGVDQ
ncbi:hypothetical protein PL336_11740 [Sulfitobacter faviae]|uniref:Uncharacterized protein n=1 Tax=Sulfitobacter faviae TaxID=1775881 RepID=A0AAX3LLC2_9RHOB|nr:hypothetical protein [Sulfitobacter faviae]WCE69471.1 hypothetical protein PL336_11740 [Sulfitobacter faviae]